jgi:hypothetical protein
MPDRGAVKLADLENVAADRDLAARRVVRDLVLLTAHAGPGHT